MNEKLRNYVDILFAAAPKTAKAAEVKEELLTNLNDKYNDLLSQGYDSTAAFHIALSGIGDLDELFKECGEAEHADSSKFAESFAESLDAVKKGLKTTPTSTLIAVAIALMAFALLFPGAILFWVPGAVFFNLLIPLCLAARVGLLVYDLLNKEKSGNNGSAPLDSVTPDDITFKRIVAGILGILRGIFGVHKFYLGFTATGLIMLLVSVLSVFTLAPVMAIIGFVEGILYLLKSDREFYREYVVRRRNWF
jgi:TM2 domain-containing membrane protein YozV